MINLRRLRSNPHIRDMVRETTLRKEQLIYPLFIEEGKGIRNEISSMPGVYRNSLDEINQELDQLLELGIKSVLLFGIPENKDAEGSESWNDEGIIQQATRQIKKSHSELHLISDVCFCEYTDHGHCGVLNNDTVDNDITLENTVKQVLSHANAGVDMVAPSGMMDNVVGAIRMGLDDNNYDRIPIMSYSAKYASAFYGPFREAADSTPSFGDRKTYQMDPANRDEALREVSRDVEQGADIIMVKPAMAYLDIIRDVKNHFNVPLAAYNVSGEYAMIKSAGAKGWIDEQKVMMESMTAISRAGADIIITYFAKDIVKLME